MAIHVGSNEDTMSYVISLLIFGKFCAFKACAHKYVHYYNFTNRDEHASYGACYRFSNDFLQEYKVNY